MSPSWKARHVRLVLFSLVSLLATYLVWQSYLRECQWRPNTHVAAAGQLDVQGAEVVKTSSPMMDQPKDVTHDEIATSTTPEPQRSVPCFVTEQMAANGNFLEPIQDLGAIGIRMDGFRYIVMTNDDRLDTKDWEKVVISLDTSRYVRVKTHVTYGKFLGWRHPALDTCRVVFVMDALNVPVNNATLWYEYEKQVLSSPGGLLAQLKPKNRTILEMMDMLPKMKKETREMVDRTKEWLINRPDFRNDTQCLWCNFFGYDPVSTLYQKASSEFWDLYSSEMLTARDQPLWSYMVERWNLQPAYFQISDSTLRPHVHVCNAKERILCQLLNDQPGMTMPADKNVTAEQCKKHQTKWETHLELVNVSDAFQIDCNKREGGHTMSVSNTFS